MKFPLLKFMSVRLVALTTMKSLTALMFIMLLTIGIPAQRSLTVKSAETLKVFAQDPSLIGVPTPVAISGNPTCATLNASTDPAFAHITQDFGLKINRSGDPPFNEQFFFVNGTDTELQGGAAPSPGSFVWVDANGNTLNWSSNRLITAVIIKGGTIGANVYPYNPPSQGADPDGIGLDTGNQNDISHIVFCFESLAPTAAPASVSGRVVDSFGWGIGGARIDMADAQNGGTWSVLTNPFGYYTINGPEVGNFYIMTISHKRYTFADDTRTFTLNEDLVDVDWVANP